MTSPTCIREIEAAFDISVTGKVIEANELRFNAQLAKLKKALAIRKRPRINDRLHAALFPLLGTHWQEAL